MTPLSQNNPQLPSPLTRQESTTTQSFREGTVTPPKGLPPAAKPASQVPHHRVTPGSSPPSAAFSSPPPDTQPFSQFVLPSQSLSRDVLDEEREGVWGYLLPVDHNFGDTLVLRKRSACARPGPSGEFGRGGEARAKGETALKNYEEEEDKYEEAKQRGMPSGGYLIGRHPECGKPPNTHPIGVSKAEADQCVQTAPSSPPPSPTGTASSSARTRAAAPSRCSRTCRRMAPSSTRPSSGATAGASCRRATRSTCSSRRRAAPSATRSRARAAPSTSSTASCSSWARGISPPCISVWRRVVASAGR